MGMFDSLYVELDNREQELQTKRFDCVLGHYRLGDWVAGSPPGIRVYFDPLWLDETGRRVYSAEAGCARKLTVFVVLAQGVFVDYQVHEGELAAGAVEPLLRALRDRWADSARLQGFLVETLRSRQRRIADLEHRLGRVRSILDSARRLQAGETLEGVFGWLHEDDRRLVAGEAPLEVIAGVLADEVRDEGWSGNDPPADPLEEYRL